MKMLLSLVLVGWLTACSSTPTEIKNELILMPSDPEKSLEIDEQFLNKSQRRVGLNSGKLPKKAVLQP